MSRVTRSRWRFPLRDQIIIALVAAMIVAAKFYFRVPLKIPGHSGIFWMALLVIGTGVVRRPGAGTLIGLISGILATLIVPGRLGIFAGVKYFVPGVVVDLLGLALGGRLDRTIVAVIVAAMANVAKLAASYMMGLAAGVPPGYLALGLGLAATTHVLFGGLGGLVAAVVLRRLDRTGVMPPAAALRTEEATGAV
ncbi:MAG: cobalt ABC transporter permease [Coriobacteriia bacterium]|nr:cobalt ABC transporter permease [Coriobacteriia bacterium]